MRSMVEGCPALDRVTPLRQAFGLPPPLAGEEYRLPPFGLSEVEGHATSFPCV